MKRIAGDLHGTIVAGQIDQLGATVAGRAREVDPHRLALMLVAQFEPGVSAWLRLDIDHERPAGRGVTMDLETTDNGSAWKLRPVGVQLSGTLEVYLAVISLNCGACHNRCPKRGDQWTPATAATAVVTRRLARALRTIATVVPSAIGGPAVPGDRHHRLLARRT